MGTLVKIGTWLKKYWYIPVFLIGMILVWMFFRRRGTPIKQTIAEVKAIQAEAEIEKLEAVLGTEKAKEAVAQNYNAELEALDKQQQEQAKELRDDPGKLAKFLVRASGKSNR